MTTIERGPGWEVRLGRWQDVLADVGEVDSLVADPPYGARTHEGHDGAVLDGNRPREKSRWKKANGTSDVVCVRRALTYTMWAEADVHEFVASWSPRVRGWFVAMTSHDLVPAYQAALEEAGRYVFAPLPFYSPGSRVRLSGDGPSSWTCWIVVARPRTEEFHRWGTLPGGYVSPPEAMPVVGGKPVGVMRALIRDYTRPGDLVADPFCGGGTTALACAMEGRRCITSEVDPATFDLAVKRLRKGHTPDMFTGGAQ